MEDSHILCCRNWNINYLPLSLLLELQTFCAKWGEENCLCKSVSPALQSLKTSMTIQHFRPSTSCFRDYLISELNRMGTTHCTLFCIWLRRSRTQTVYLAFIILENPPFWRNKETSFSQREKCQIMQNAVIINLKFFSTW